MEQLGFLLGEYYRRYPALRGQETVHWFLDEIQLVSGWERFVRRVLDSEKVEIAVSGSSARMLSREVHTSLRGRGIATVIRPFSFREFLRHRGEEPKKRPGQWRAAERSLVEKRFREFLVEGGFPEAQGLAAPLRIELLQGYVDTVLRHALETAVLNELERRRTAVGYVKTPDGLEVDFLARHPGGGEELIQVCADVFAPDTLARELRALTAAAQHHSRAVRRLLVLDRDALTRVNEPGIEVQPAYEWPLATPNKG